MKMYTPVKAANIIATQNYIYGVVHFPSNKTCRLAIIL